MRGGTQGQTPQVKMVLPQQGQPQGQTQRGGTQGSTRGRANLPTPPKQTQSPPSMPTATAMYDYDAQTGDELGFKEGEVLTILTKDPGGWWEGKNAGGKTGWVPANYLKPN